MSKDRSAISALVSDFAEQIEALVRQAALEHVNAVFAGVSGTSTVRRGPGRPQGSKLGRPAKRIRRASGDMDAMQDRLLAHVKANPGQRGEQIAAAMRSDVTTIRLPMKKLIAARKVTTKGQRRGMMYFAGGGAARPAAAKATKKKGRRKAKRATRPRWARKSK